MFPGATITALWRPIPFNDHLDLFATDTSSIVWSSWREPSQWNEWFTVNNDVPMYPGATVSAIWYSLAFFNLYATDASGTVWCSRSIAPPGGDWLPGPGVYQPWFQFRPQVTMFPGATVTVQYGPVDEDESVTDTDGTAWFTWWNTDKTPIGEIP